MHFTPPTRPQNVSCINKSVDDWVAALLPTINSRLILLQLTERRKNLKWRKRKKERNNFLRHIRVGTVEKEYRVGIKTIIYDANVGNEMCVINIPSRTTKATITARMLKITLANLFLLFWTTELWIKWEARLVKKQTKKESNRYVKTSLTFIENLSAAAMLRTYYFSPPRPSLGRWRQQQPKLRINEKMRQSRDRRLWRGKKSNHSSLQRPD